MRNAWVKNKQYYIKYGSYSSYHPKIGYVKYIYTKSYMGLQYINTSVFVPFQRLPFCLSIRWV